mgnify:CR=1 FL=1
MKIFKQIGQLKILKMNKELVQSVLVKMSNGFQVHHNYRLEILMVLLTKYYSFVLLLMMVTVE